MTGTSRICGYCDQEMRGVASAGDVWLCHPPNGETPDCYRLVTVYGYPLQDGRTWYLNRWVGSPDPADLDRILAGEIIRAPRPDGGND